MDNTAPQSSSSPRVWQLSPLGLDPLSWVSLALFAGYIAMGLFS